ncbi:MAG: hypothetical protein P8I93_08515 [Crocinitomicaceae bacterium]|nr:hypothetical protein [Crocinitomicaceae bacterium]
MKNLRNSLFVFFFSVNLFWSQHLDTNYIETFKDKLVLYADLGFSSAPFQLKHTFENGVGELNFKNNIRPNLGLGFSYKWLALRLSFPIVNNLMDVSRYGNTAYLNFGLNFSVKKFFFDIDFKGARGYWLKNDFENDFIVNDGENLIFNNLRAINFSASSWYFKNKNFNMNAFYGKKAHYKKQVHTWSIKGTMNFFGVGNNGNLIILDELVTDATSKLGGVTFSAYDIGVIPGYAYANRIKNWQFSALLGFGAVVQSKFYTTKYNTRGFLGIAPRYDFRMSLGYSSPSFFMFFVTELDNKSIQFTDLVYRQYYYSLRLTGGYRFRKK